MSNKKILSVSSVVMLAGCATMSGSQEVADLMKTSFANRGQATVERLNQTDLQRACSDYAAQGKELPKELRAQLEKAALAAVKKPADGVWLGDWKQGERVAQLGRGMQFSDAAGSANGGNCYACHQLSPQEVSYGNLGPTLRNFGKLRNVKVEGGKPTADSMPIVEYTWGKIWNSHAYNACSNMPRFGDAGILTEKQIKDVMALLLDPQSPINK
jgi:sulfur-oxidizing protein SoxX